MWIAPCITGWLSRHRALVPGSGTRRGVPQAAQPGLGVVALGDNSGDSPADTSQRALYGLPHVVVHRSSSFSGRLFAGHYLSVAVRPSLGHRRKSLFCLLRYVLAGTETGLPGLSSPQPAQRGIQRRFCGPRIRRFLPAVGVRARNFQLGRGGRAGHSRATIFVQARRSQVSSPEMRPQAW
jgi:hypothetical protein